MRYSARRLALLGLATSAAVFGLGGAPAGAADFCEPRSVSVMDTWAGEGDPPGGGTLYFTVTTSGCAAGTVRYETEAGPAGIPAATAGVDFVVKSGQLSWAAGEAGDKTVHVAIRGDLDVEPDEVMRLRLFMPTGLFVVDDTAWGTIVDDDLELGFASQPFCDEECVACWLSVGANAPVPADVTVEFETGGGTASSGADFVATSGVVTIPRGGTRAEIGIRILNDRIVEDDERFTVTVTILGSSTARIGDATAVVTILDDDGPRLPS